MYPHERSLVKRLAGKPFVLLGVNSDEDREALKKTIAAEQITWRSWWDEGGTNGPIQTAWQVRQRPSVHLLDAHGVLRRVNVSSEDLDQAIDDLLAEIPDPKPAE